MESLAGVSEFKTPDGSKFVESSTFYDFKKCLMSNQDLHQGETYIGTDIVDSTYMLFASFESHETGPMKYYGILKSPIALARSLIIYEMLESGEDVENIFELWYQSCIS